VTCISPTTFTSYIRRHSSASASATGEEPYAPPALFTRTSSRGPTCSARAATSSSEVTSQRTAVPLSSAASAVTRSSRLAAQKT
jgi:hypothetical protein